MLDDTLLPSSDPLGRPNGHSPAVSDRRLDVAIVGGGLAGSLCALMLSRQGLDVGLFDLHASAPSEFRAEQLVGPQVAKLAALGALDLMTALSTLYPEAYNARGGRIIDRTRVDQYGVPYQHMVNAVRSMLGPSVHFFKGRVAAIDASDDEQVIALADGSAVRARLVVLATGLSSPLAKRLGITARTIRATHSLAVGFDVEILDPMRQVPLPLIYYGENIRDRIDYFALFPMHDVLRANLFCYHARDGAWPKQLAQRPVHTLLSTMPGLADILGPFTVTSPVQIRPNDLRVATDVERAGVVLIGDAFQTPCPAAGTGIDRLLSDIDVLCRHHLPGWMASPGMGRDKIAAFYRDPTKMAFDAECLRVAEYRRASTTEDGLSWAIHRKQVYVRRRAKALLLNATRLGSRRSTMGMAPL